MKIVIDENYGKTVIKLIESLHCLSGNDKYKVFRWGDIEVKDEDLNDSVFLVIEFQEKGISIPYEKLFEDGYRTFVCKTKKSDDFTRFGLALTLFTVWPSILEKSESNCENFLYTFKYGGKKLSAKHKN